MQKITIMHRLKNFVLVAFITFISVNLNAQSIYPYLHAATPNSIYITWKTSNLSTQSLVEYGINAGSLTQQTNGTTEIWSDQGYPNNYYYHVVHLTNLQPNTEYYYKVTTGTLSSQEYSFKTLPNPGMASTTDGHIRFLVFGDNQIKSQPRFDTLMVEAKRKCQEKFGQDINNAITSILMVGDQVDVGTLDHYEFVHFDKSKYLSPLLSISTVVGNHETYGTLGMNAYYNHFYYDSLAYQNIYSGNESYYAYQAGNTLIINLSTEQTSAQQFTWLQNVVNAANNDPTVTWIITLAHRPYQAEQYVGDISTWIRNTVMPFMSTSPKSVLHFGAHHHLYARGQLKNNPIYHVISGGSAWDQYWGMGTETDFDDVQKTISQWAYQLVDIDVINNTLDVEVYSVGSIYGQKENQLIDHFHRKLNLAAPQTPNIIHNFTDSLDLPLTLSSSAFASTVAEELNSTQFQVSQSTAFSVLEKDIYRDFENLFGPAGSPDTSANINLGVNILDYTIPTGQLPIGRHYVRVRHRDQNLNWSSWSVTDSFYVESGLVLDPTLSLDNTVYLLNDTIYTSYSNGPGLSTDWIGIYGINDTPGNVTSTAWNYTSGTSGILNFQINTPGQYYAAFFTNDGYTEIAPRVNFYVGPKPVVTTTQTMYPTASNVVVNYTSAPAFQADWIGVYKVGQDPQQLAAVQVALVTAGQSSGVKTFAGLADGYYFASYFLNGTNAEPSDRAYFQVGDTITQLFIDQSIYNVGEYITATWIDAPGIPKDWIGIFDSLANPQFDPLISYAYFNGQTAGTKTLTDTLLPQNPGSYFISIFTNDSYTEVSNRRYFRVIDSLALTPEINGNSPVKVFPNPSNSQFNIQCVYPIEKMELLNNSGQVVFATRNVNNQKFSLVSHQLPRGVYHLKVYTRMTYTLKIVVE